MIHSLITLFSRLLRGDGPAAHQSNHLQTRERSSHSFPISLEAKLFRYFYIRHGGMIDTFVHNRERLILDT